MTLRGNGGVAMFLHCLEDGTAFVSGGGGLGEAALPGDGRARSPSAPHEVAVLPYEDGMNVIVRAELANGTRCCTTVCVEGLSDGEIKAIVDLEAAGDGAKVVSCVVKGGLTGGDDGRARTPCAPDSNDGRAQSPSAPQSDDGGTPSELWASGIKNVPSALPSGNIPFLTMQKFWYEEIECGAKDVEHRKQCSRYRKWFVDHHPAAVKLQCGYTDRQMIWEVVEVEDGGDDGIFIHLGKRIV